MTDALPDDAREMTTEEKEIRACDWSDYRKAFGEDPDRNRNKLDYMLFTAGWDAGRRSAIPKNPAWLITPHGEKVPIPSHVAAQIRSIEYRNDQPVRVVTNEVLHPYFETPEEAVSTIEEDIAKAATLSEAVHLAIGNASTHWENMMGAGVYQEAQARAVADAVLQRMQLSIAELTEAIRLTVEYVGLETLPPIEGWSWYDALVKYSPNVAERFRELFGESVTEDREITQAEEPREWAITRAFANGYREGLERAMRGRLDHS